MRIQQSETFLFENFLRYLAGASSMKFGVETAIMRAEHMKTQPRTRNPDQRLFERVGEKGQ